MTYLQAMALAALLATPAFATEVLEIMVKRGAGQTIAVSVGDLKGQAIPSTVVTALNFLVRWGRGAKDLDPTLPVTVRGEARALKDVSLLLPTSGFQALEETPTVARVRVPKIGVKTVDGPTTGVAAVLTLERPSAAGLWKVTKVDLH